MPQNPKWFNPSKARSKGTSQQPPGVDPRQRRLPSGVKSAVLPLPTVTTIGINSITATSANVVGSINPNGHDTIWWVTYGTSLPLPGLASFISGFTAQLEAALGPQFLLEEDTLLGTPISIGSGNTPITVTETLTGLTEGTTYYVAVVGESDAGTVLGATLSFVAENPVVPIAPGASTIPFVQPVVTIPHFDEPFALTAAEGARVVEQDTIEEVRSNVFTIASCVIGQCVQLPFFGRPDLTFSNVPIDTKELVSAIQDLEPRASEDAFGDFARDETTWNILLTTTMTGAGGS